MAKIEKFQQELLDAIQLIEDRVTDLSDNYSITFSFTAVTNDGDPEVDVIFEQRVIKDGKYQDVELDSDIGFSDFGEALKAAANQIDGWGY